MEYTNTIWMGNLTGDITERDIIMIFDQFSKYIFDIYCKILKIEYRINDINIFYKSYNYGYAFIEFDSVKIAKIVIQQYNGRLIGGQYLRLNFGKENIKYPKKSNKIYTVSLIFLIYFLIQLFISNIDENVDNPELFKFFKKKYESIKSVCIVYDKENDKSRGFGFLNVRNYIDFLDILRNTRPFFLRDRKLVIK